MVKKYTLQLLASEEEPEQLVTKFGGQPLWLDRPQWPLSRSTGVPMTFIGQIVLYSDLFGTLSTKVAYLFQTVHSQVDNTWDADGGENALILQPSSEVSNQFAIQASGPTVSQRIYIAQLEYGEDPDRFDEDLARENEQVWKDYTSHWEDFKVGGTPIFLENEEYPDNTHVWRLLLQMPSTRTPFLINFGDGGIGYAFISGDGTSARWLWQG